MLTLFPTWSILELEKDLRRRCFRIDELRDHPFCSVLPSLLGEELTTAAACKQKIGICIYTLRYRKRRQFFGPQKLIGIVCVRTSSDGDDDELGEEEGRFWPPKYSSERRFTMEQARLLSFILVKQLSRQSEIRTKPTSRLTYVKNSQRIWSLALLPDAIGF